MSVKIIKLTPELKFDLTKRVYVNNKTPSKGKHIFDRFDIYFANSVSDNQKLETDKGIQEFLDATNLRGIIRLNYVVDSLERITDLSLRGDYLAQQDGAYKIFIKPPTNQHGFNGFAGENFAVINSNDFNQKYLVAHEIGHLFNAANRLEKINLFDKNKLNPEHHCLNDKLEHSQRIIIPCVMQSGTPNQNTLSKVGAIYCPDCVKDMKEYINK